ncbi:MAG: peptide-methionine (S)-S-oxide reductase MsrA [Treponema sp.]|jgi:peptide methionine sulfoxide reductase msrA/msrB|nr:peptide-methionine (S)-S-oxide reductase MsrA [Treponema sp.]
MKEIYLAGGCFWGVEKYLGRIPGVLATEAGYANGPVGEGTDGPAYEDVCRSSGHAETVKVVYDESALALTKLLDTFYAAIDPVSVNRQGPDTGIQYRTGVYYVDEADRSVIEASLKSLQSRCDDFVAVEAAPLANYYRAEEYHQKYLEKNPQGYCHIRMSD